MTFTLNVCTLNGNCAEKDFHILVDNLNEPPYFDTGDSKYGNKNMLRILIKVTKEEFRTDFPEPNFEYNSPKAIDPNGDEITMKLTGI